MKLLLGVLVLTGLALVVWRRALPRSLGGMILAVLAAAGLALENGSSAAAASLVGLGLGATAVIGLQHLRRREGEGGEPKRARPGLVVAAFVLVPWMVLVGGVLDSETPALVEGEAVRGGPSLEEAPVEELLAILLVAVGLAATVALTAGRRGGLDR